MAASAPRWRRIYVAGPYTAASVAEKQANVNRAIDAALVILAKGHYPYIPHLTHFVNKRALKTGGTLSWDDYIRWDLVWLELCDALLFLGPSPGADLELAAARAHGLEIFESLKAIPDVAQTH